ncbi:ABC transporter substrate-binding protein [Halorubrum lipolyticum]|uniref:4,5-dihydroxyphthalate decarboxylase n=1 Tax=Halorubrum lipolyticum DSM 21995 TaxID=1227482 RepID=M0NYJ2_9EURY|nr:ABC transporter substrate-binding protein [Halorubrum lipolyticum]EMA62896.1 4,5-dihydroxyphthalate decarboxylase [Halorubrum lipolyticum DSM 21995]
MTLDLTLACHDYAWTEPLWDGRVTPEGVDLTAVDYPNPTRFSRMVHGREFDACELSMGTYLASRSDPDRYPFTAIPVFPFRKFRHSYMYKRTDAGIDSIGDLDGKRVGIVNWQTTTGIWQRGTLAERHGVDLSSIEWVAGGSEIVDVDVPDRYDVEYLDHQRSMVGMLTEMLDRGDLDAVFHPIDLDGANVERLFDDVKSVEQEYFRETSIFPIMHAIALEDELLREKPWVAQNLYDAFERAKEIGLSTLDRPRDLPLVWADIHADEQREVLGEDPWEYGLSEGNVATLERLIDHAHRQGVADERYGLEELFATEHLETPYFA